jgi:hypothetical protein
VSGSFRQDSEIEMRAIFNRLPVSYKRRVAAIFTLALFATVVFADLADDFVPLRDNPAIEYATRPTDDPISILNMEIEAGRTRLSRNTHETTQRSRRVRKACGARRPPQASLSL